MATEIFTGVVIEAGWHTEGVVDAYWITLDTDPQSESGLVMLRGTDRLNVVPATGQRIRVAGKLTPKGHYSITKLSDDIDPESGMVVQIEVL